jgi:hypothetical protein
MGNCFTLIYVLNQVSGSGDETLENVSGFIGESDLFLDNVLDLPEIEAPDYLIQRVLEKAGNS